MPSHRKSRVAHCVRVLSLIGLLLAPLPATPALASAPQRAPAAPESPADTPIAMVGSGVRSYLLQSPKLFWYTPGEDCPPAASAGKGTGLAAPALSSQVLFSETVKRVASTGSGTRTLYARSVACSSNTIRSTIASDEAWLYWVTAGGVVRESFEANPDDVPEVINASVTPGVAAYVETAVGPDYVYVLKSTASNTTIYRIPKAGGAAALILNTSNPYGSQLQYDGQYIYFLSDGTVERLNIGVSVVGIAGKNVGGELRPATTFHAEGARAALCGFSICTTRRVYFAVGNQVNYYDSESSTMHAGFIYTSVDAGASIQTLSTTPSTIFFIIGGSATTNKLLIGEARPSGGSGFITYTPVLIRTGRGGGTADALYTGPGGFSSSALYHLTNDGAYIFFQSNDTIQRLAIDAAALPIVNVKITGIEVTQGVQDLLNTVRLVRKRRTFVRVYVAADGAPVNAIKALLHSNASSFVDLLPVNTSGTQLTVRTSPSRNDLEQSFLFELPWDWTDRASLTLTADINPYKVPLESNYADDSRTIVVNFSPSPRLSAEFFRINFQTGGVWHRPRINKDVLQTYSWIMRAYPIGGAIGENFKPRLWDVNDDGRVASWVLQTSGDCNTNGGNAGNLCASYYVNGWLKFYRDHAWVPNTGDFYYGMIPDDAGFPRGQAMYDKTSVGPSGSGTWGWDTDGSYADWYAAHEIGHSLGRAHPTPSATPCGNSASDNSFPYTGGQIGPADGRLNGFDAGDPGFGIPRAVYPGTSWFDVMTYCNNQWISDYTYKAMYDFMIANPSAVTGMRSAAEAETDESIRAVMLNGDFLSISGQILTATNSASLAFVARLASVTHLDSADGGPYAIRLLNASDGVLSSVTMSPAPSADGAGLVFDRVINFSAGTRKIQIIRTSDNSVLLTRAVSASVPVISNVALVNPPSPVVHGTVTLGWSASDADGDALTFDVFYSRDGGATWQPVTMGTTGNSVQFDTAQLGGSATAVFRVSVSDGVNTAEAGSAQFTMFTKAPTPSILLPAPNTHVHFGQLVNFSGVALDVQDGLVGQGGLQWGTDGGLVLGTGGLASTDQLRAGPNTVYFTATNSLGLSASASVMVYVDDDLSPSGPALSVGPTSVAWHAPAGSTTPQQALLSLTNPGTGTATWSLSVDKPWVTVTPITGTIGSADEPVTLTVTGDPSGLLPNATHMATLTIVRAPSGGGDVTQTLSVPVSFGLGDTWRSPNSANGTRAWLPLTMR